MDATNKFCSYCRQLVVLFIILAALVAAAVVAVAALTVEIAAS